MFEALLEPNDHDFAETHVQKWQARIHAYYRRWMDLAACAEPSVLYRTNEHFGLNFKDIGLIGKQVRIVKWHIHKHSKDPQARALYRWRLKRDGHIGTGRKTSPCLRLEKLEGTASIRRIVEKA